MLVGWPTATPLFQTLELDDAIAETYDNKRTDGDSTTTVLSPHSEPPCHQHFPDNFDRGSAPGRSPL